MALAVNMLNVLGSGGGGGGGGGAGTGTVTTVGFTGGLISVATPTTTPALTVAGTSGGIVYFSAASTWASSAALTSNSLVLGGGAGGAPKTAAGFTTDGTSALTLGAAGTGTGALLVKGTTSGTVTVTSAAAAGTWTLTLPTTGGTNNYFLQTDGSGTTTWAAGGAGTISSGTTNRLSKYTTATTLGNSLVSDDGTTLTYTGTGGIAVNSGSTAGAIVLTQGTTQSTGTTNITIQAPTGVTSYIRTLPGAVGTSGFLFETVAGSVQTESLVASTGSGNVVLATSATLVTPVLGTPTSGNLSNCTADGTSTVGFREIPQNSKSAAYTTVLSDNGKHIYHPSADTTARTWTIDSNANVAYPIGTAITFVNDTSAGTLTIAITSDTMVLFPGGSTGSRTLTAGNQATALKVTSTRWVISGTSGLT